MNLKKTLYNINRSKESFFNIDKGKFINYVVLRKGILVTTTKMYSERKFFKYSNKFINYSFRDKNFIWISHNPKTTIPTNKDVNLSYKGYFAK